MKLTSWIALLAFFAIVQGQGTAPPTGDPEMAALKKELAALKEKVASFDWLNSHQYCLFKKGDCPPGFQSVSLKTWVQKGVSGHVSFEQPPMEVRFPWPPGGAHNGGGGAHNGKLNVIHQHEDETGNIGDSYLKKKCIKKGDNELCFGNLGGLVANPQGAFAADFNANVFATQTPIDSNELVLAACCKL